MILRSLPGSDQTRVLLLDVLTVIWVALEVGILKAREYFAQEGTLIDPYLAANITRYHAASISQPISRTPATSASNWRTAA